MKLKYLWEILIKRRIQFLLKYILYINWFFFGFFCQQYLLLCLHFNTVFCDVQHFSDIFNFDIFMFLKRINRWYESCLDEVQRVNRWNYFGEHMKYVKAVPWCPEYVCKFWLIIMVPGFNMNCISLFQERLLVKSLACFFRQIWRITCIPPILFSLSKAEH